jgi:5,10-methylenetetrahydromethanopterin reductase
VSTTTDGRPALGFVVRPELAPEDLPAVARRVEAAGFDELWLWEDCFFAGGVATAATVLATTSRIRVGLGIMPAPVRNPVFAAMEIAALARLYPGRFLPGLGHGVADWMRQVGAMPASQLGLMDETVTAIRSLLAGDEVSIDGRFVHIDAVRLDHPPDDVPPVSIGVRRARSLALSGRVADGTILSEPTSVPYITWAREQIAATRPHRLTVYTWCSMNRDGPAARAALRPLVAERLPDGGPQVEVLDIGEVTATTEILDEWIDRVAVVGTPEECATSIRALADAGAHTVVLVPPTPDVDPESLAGELLPRM